MNEDQRVQLESRVDALMRLIFPDREPRSVEMHTVSLVGHHPEKSWKGVEGLRRKDALDKFRDILLDVKPLFFGEVLNKTGYWNNFTHIVPEAPAPHAMRYLLRRVDGYVSSRREETTLTIDDDSRELKDSFEEMIRKVRTEGDKLTPAKMNVSHYKTIKDPQFVDSKAVRGIQAADFVAYWTFRAAEALKSNRLRELDSLWIRGEPKVWYSPAARTEIIGNRPVRIG